MVNTKPAFLWDAGFFLQRVRHSNPHGASPKTCTRASKSSRKTAIRDARVHVLRSRGGCTDMCSRHISPKCGRSDAPHAPYARERAQRRTHHANARDRAQRCSPKPAAAPTQPQQGRKRRRPRFPLFRNPQRAARGHRNKGKRGLRREQTTYATLTIQPSGPSISPA